MGIIFSTPGGHYYRLLGVRERGPLEHIVVICVYLELVLSLITVGWRVELRCMRCHWRATAMLLI